MKDLILSCPFNECNRVYTNRFNLKRHVEACHGETKRFQCKHCSKVLSSKQNLKEHLFTHSGEKPYVCREPGCGLRFRQGSQLSAHRRIHTAIRRFTVPEEPLTLKVSPSQLTALLEKNPEFFTEKYEILATGAELVSLPELSAQRVTLTVPNIFSVD